MGGNNKMNNKIKSINNNNNIVYKEMKYICKIHGKIYPEYSLKFKKFICPECGGEIITKLSI